MDISLKWLNQYLTPSGLGAEEAEALLTDAGLPFEGTKTLANGDVVMDVEVTSNRGDCLSHIGCAREIAAASSHPEASAARSLNRPTVDQPKAGAPISDDLRLENRVPEGCPLFTAQLIRGVTIGPSPDWLVEALESIGARSINNVVDITNFITFEMGNPCHVFDHAKLAGGELIVRYADKGERIRTLYEGEHELVQTDLVVADAERPQSLAGVIGGFDSQVDDHTTDVVFEMATWDPVTIRTTGRRLNIRTDAAYRFERFIDPRTIEAAAARAVALICEVSGGERAEGVLSAGAPLPVDQVIDLRPSRCEKVIGVETPAAQIAELLEGLEIKTEVAGDDLVRCTVPAHRSRDLTREIDLVEEVARARTLAVVPTSEKVAIEVHAPNNHERAVREITRVLTGLGFYETVTFSFTSPERAAQFCPKGVEPVAVDDNRRKAEPTLRPSVLPSLLACRAGNQDGRVEVDGGVRLFELAAVYGQDRNAASVERRLLTMAMDVPGQGTKRSAEQKQQGLRQLRGAIEAVARACFGGRASLIVEAGKPDAPGWDESAYGLLTIDGQPLGRFGLVSANVQDHFGLSVPALAAELELSVLTSAYPPMGQASALPKFPGVDRDLSVIVDEDTSWHQIDGLVSKASLDQFIGSSLVGVFRGKQIGAGKKSVTMRLSFRDPERTLRHEEVDPQMARLTEMAKAELKAEIRG